MLLDVAQAVGVIGIGMSILHLLVNTATSYCRALSLGQVSFELITSKPCYTRQCVLLLLCGRQSNLSSYSKQKAALLLLYTYPNPRVMHACETWRTCGIIGFGNGNNGHSACMSC